MLLKANPVEPEDFGPFENPWGNPWIPGSNPRRQYERGRHGGLDFQGVYWIACADGIVRERNYGPAYGLQAQIDFEFNGHIYEATYSHGAALYHDAGEHITAGTRLGKVGATGQVTGAHLHWELHKTPGNWYSDFDPAPYIKELAMLAPEDKTWLVKVIHDEAGAAARATLAGLLTGYNSPNNDVIPDGDAGWNSALANNLKAAVADIKAAIGAGIDPNQIVSLVKQALREGAGA